METLDLVLLGSEASQDRIEALRRKLSNQANSVTAPEIPGAPCIAQSSGAYSAGANETIPPTVVDSQPPASLATEPAGEPLGTFVPPYGRYHPRENDFPRHETQQAAQTAQPAESGPTGLTTPPPVVEAPTPAEEVDVGDSVSMAEGGPPVANPYWKFLDSKARNTPCNVFWKAEVINVLMTCISCNPLPIYYLACSEVAKVFCSQSWRVFEMFSRSHEDVERSGWSYFGSFKETRSNIAFYKYWPQNVEDIDSYLV